MNWDNNLRSAVVSATSYCVLPSMQTLNRDTAPDSWQLTWSCWLSAGGTRCPAGSSCGSLSWSWTSRASTRLWSCILGKTSAQEESSNSARSEVGGGGGAGSYGTEVEVQALKWHHVISSWTALVTSKRQTVFKSSCPHFWPNLNEVARPAKLAIKILNSVWMGP